MPETREASLHEQIGEKAAIPMQLIVTPLVTDELTFDNMVNNPILKPIAQIDKSYRDLQEIIYKKTIDANRDKDAINKAIDEFPTYGDSPMIAKFIKYSDEIQDIVKMQDIQIKTFITLLQDIVKMVETKYGVLTERTEKKAVEQKQSIPPKKYLVALSKHKNPVYQELANKAIEVYDSFEDQYPHEEKRYYEAILKVFTEELDKKKKSMIALMSRKELAKEVMD